MISAPASPRALPFGPLLSKLLDAFVEMLAPAVARFASRRRWVAAVEGDGLAWYEVENGRSKPVARSGDAESVRRLAERARGGTVELRLPPEQVLQRTLRLPEAGREFIGRVIEHRLSRLTPWAPEKVLYGFRITGEAGPDGQLGVAFAATSAEFAAAAERRLADLGLTPTALGTTAEPIEEPLGLDLYRGTRGAGQARLRRRTALTIAAVAVVLAPLCLLSFWLAGAAEERVRSADTRLARARAAILAASGEGPERARDRALIGAKRPETSVLVLMDRLGAVIPDNTYLSDLEIDPDKVRLVGRSGDAPALIGLLEANAGLAKVRFAAPVIRDAEGRDGFDIVAARPDPAAEEAR